MKDYNKSPLNCWRKLSMFKIWQKEDEIVQLLEIIRERSMENNKAGLPFVTVEIGSYSGGTAILFAQYSDLVIGVDMADPLAGCDNVRYVVADSHSPEAYKGVMDQLLKAEQNGIDFLFIDGDHTENGSTEDFFMYKKLLNSKAIVAFHDIANSEHHTAQGCRVDLTWQKVKDFYSTQVGYRTEEIKSPNENFWGEIGIVYTP